MATEYLTCSVSEAGPSINSNETALPVIMICLTDSGGKFSNTWFYAAQDAKTRCSPWHSQRSVRDHK